MSLSSTLTTASGKTPSLILSEHIYIYVCVCVCVENGKQTKDIYLKLMNYSLFILFLTTRFDLKFARIQNIFIMISLLSLF